MTAVAVPAGRSARDLAGTPTLLRLALRRDRVLIPVWVLAISGSAVSTVSRIETSFPTAADRADLVRDSNANGSTRALFGIAFGDSLGAVTAWRVAAYLTLAAALMSALIVVRHTREEEETGRQEALAAGQVGRRAGLTSALLAVGIANAAVTLLVAAAVAGQGGAGAVGLGLAVGLSGLAFGGVAAVAAQLTENARVARGLATGAVGLAFLLRMTGDAARDDVTGLGNALLWLSPLGWAENARPFAAERWWLLGLLAAFGVATAAAAYALAGRRDVGASFLPARPGRAHAGPALAGVFGLAWRLQRGTVAAWAVGLVIAGVLFGSVAASVDDLLGDAQDTRDTLARYGGSGAFSDVFLAAMVGILGLVVSIFAVGSVLRLRAEETDQHAEPVLATAVGRIRWAAGHLVVAFLGSAALMAVCGLALGVAYGVARDDVGGQLPRTLGAAVAEVPAIWSVAGAATFLFGLFPRLTYLAWGVVGYVVAVGWLGPALNVPQFVLDVSPFGHLPKLPGGEIEVLPFGWLLALTALLTAAALVGLRRRDLAT